MWLHLNESREGFRRRGRERSYIPCRWTEDGSGETGARNLEAGSVRSREVSTGGCVKLKTVTGIRRSSARETFTAENACLSCTTHLRQRMHVYLVPHINSRECMFILYYPLTAENACLSCTTHLQQRMHVYPVLPIYSRKCMFILYYPFTAENACLSCTTHLQQKTHVYPVLHIYSRNCMFILY